MPNPQVIGEILRDSEFKYRHFYWFKDSSGGKLTVEDCHQPPKRPNWTMFSDDQSVIIERGLHAWLKNGKKENNSEGEGPSRIMTSPNQVVDFVLMKEINLADG